MQMNGLNKRHLRSKEIKSETMSIIPNIIEINGMELISIFDRRKSSNLNEDVLVYFYNNWCGFCSVLNFNLMKMVYKYFSSASSFKLFKYLHFIFKSYF